MPAMEEALRTAVGELLHWLAVPQVGLGAVFVIALVSATLLPMGSEPAVFALVKWQPDMFWPAILVATAGNVVGGMITWWMGWWAHAATDHWRHPADPGAPGARDATEPPRWKRAERQALAWLQRHGARACLLSWLPVVGDPLCAVAGWLRLPFWPCVAYMAVGKGARYLTMTSALLSLT